MPGDQVADVLRARRAGQALCWAGGRCGQLSGLRGEELNMSDVFTGGPGVRSCNLMIFRLDRAGWTDAVERALPILRFDLPGR